MCKVLMISNTSMLDDAGRIELVNTAMEHIIKGNSDGFGFAGIDESNNYYGFKTVDYNVLYEPEAAKETLLQGIVKSYKFEYFGNHDKVSDKGMIFHGRTSTNKEGVKNAHPVMINNSCLVHNGVVNSKKAIKQVLDTDTELLCHMVPTGKQKHTEKMSELKRNLETNITGYYAFFNLNKDGSVTVVRDEIATLYMTYVPEIEAQLIGTTRELLKDVCETLGWEHKSIYAVEDNIMFRMTNENVIKDVLLFESLGYSAIESDLAMTSLGRALDSDPYYGFSSETNGTKSLGYSEADLSQIKGDKFDTNKYFEAETMLLEELELADASWTFSHRGHPITLEAFKSLTPRQKLYECDVYAWDGQELNIDHYIQMIDEDIKYERKNG